MPFMLLLPSAPPGTLAVLGPARRAAAPGIPPNSKLPRRGESRTDVVQDRARRIRLSTLRRDAVGVSTRRTPRVPLQLDDDVDGAVDLVAHGLHREGDVRRASVSRR